MRRHRVTSTVTSAPGRDLDRFWARIALGFLLAATVGAGLQVLVAARLVEDQVLERQELTYQADARVLERTWMGAVGADEHERTAELTEVLDVVAAQAGVHEVVLKDAAGEVVATNGENGRGTRSKAHLHRFEIPVQLDAETGTLAVAQDLWVVEEQVQDLRVQALYLALGGPLAGLLVFHLLVKRPLRRGLAEVVLTDTLTGLLNHRAFQDELRSQLRSSKLRVEPLTLAVLDLDGFKAANDSRGHQHGDALLRQLGEVLERERSGRSPDLQAFRLGGDEFALLLPGHDEGRARGVVERIRSEVEKNLVGVSVSTGFSTCLGVDVDPEVLIGEADAALYEAKDRGRNRTVAYSELGGSRLIVSSTQIAAIRELLEEGSVRAAYQPIVHLATGDVLAYEALARPDTRTGLRGPQDAFDVAERTGQVHALDALCRTVALRDSAHLPQGPLLFVNVHPMALAHDLDLVDGLLQAAGAAGRRPDQVVVEVTERVSRAGVGGVLAGAARLRRAGFQLALDDVGEGNSGLEMLSALPVEFVKISRNVLLAAMEDGPGLGVLHAVLAFAQHAGAYVIAEGIEDEAMLDLVQHPTRGTALLLAGASGGQGYLLGRPAPAAAYVTLPEQGGAALAPVRT